MTRELKAGRREPRSGKVGSIVIFLHGYGADGADLMGLADPLSDYLPDTLFLAPDAPERPAGSGFGYQWFPIPWLDGSSQAAAAAGLARAGADLDAFFDNALSASGLTPAKTVVIGFSQGAMMALEVLPRRPVPVAGIVAISGRLLRPEALAAEAVSRPPVLLIHGDRDEVVPFAEMALAGEALTAAGFETFGHVMRGSGHGIAPDGLGAALAFAKDRLASF